MTGIEKEILEATGAKKKKKSESDQEYYQRLIATADDNLDDDTWTGLSEEAQVWINNGAEAISSKEDIEDFDAVEDTEDEVEEEAPVKEKEAKKGSKESSPKKETKALTKKDVDEKADDQKKTRKRTGATEIFVELMCKNRDTKRDEVYKMLLEKGEALSKSTADVIYYDVKKTLSVLDRLGMLK